MDIATGALLFAAAVVAGAQNAVAGGGSFLTLPSLLFAGVLPIQANATSTVALWPGSVASAFGYREDLRRAGRGLLLPLSIVALLGGLAGALLLLRTPQETFRAALPWLMLVATVAFAAGPPLTRRLQARDLHMPRWLLVALQFAIATYGGYFGGGMGFMMLAAYSAMGMEDVHVMNAIKSVMGVLLNAIAIVAFLVAGVVEWPFALLMVAGSTAGGYLGARYGRRVPGAWMRAYILAVGIVITTYLFLG